jgi:hypothetical protein
MVQDVCIAWRRYQMRFNLEVNLDNDAMCSPAGLAEALEDLSGLMRSHSLSVQWEGLDAFDRKGRIRDANGNGVGTWTVTE